MNTVLRFIACSDLHFKADVATEPERFRRGMQLAYEYAASQNYKSIDAVYFVGDFSNSGSEEEMRIVKEYADACVAAETKQVYMLASHEFFSPDKQAGAVNRLKTIFGQSPDQHHIINGFHFISVSTENGCRIGDQKKEWIRTQLAEAAEQDHFKPIFFFQHPHLTDTVYGSICWGEDDIISILMDYPQIIDFSGHSHAPVNDPRSIYQKHFTCVGTGSLSYFELDEFDYIYGTIPPDKDQCAQFMIVEVKEDNSVVIKPFDILSGKFFNEGYSVEKPWDPDSFIYTDARWNTNTAPFFAVDAEMRVERRGELLMIDFPQAVCVPERPDSYKIVIKCEPDGYIVKQLCVSSSYYIYNMPKSVHIEIPFERHGNFSVSVTANSFWNTASAPLKKVFEVPSHD